VEERPITEWKGKVVNDFEEAFAPKHPEMMKIKQDLYEAGAFYAAMSGSGSTFYGIFKEKSELPAFSDYSSVWIPA
jgi:4-diphosphocytidyl-2-C-methyl-D-erythritol kinase